MSSVLKFRIYYEEDESVHRDIIISPHHNFFDLHLAILKAYNFDTKEKATFYRSNQQWEEGKQISLSDYSSNESDDIINTPAVLMMKETTIDSEIIETDQRFIYVYDFNKNFTFLIELIDIIKNYPISEKSPLPVVLNFVGDPPLQYPFNSPTKKAHASLQKNKMSDLSDDLSINDNNSATD
ncbi:MAG: hypothetical protein QM528_01850 [Phycisphaerales bacterium]|nr:hypothetical protein [Phycisphaerales bacterium]